MNEHSTFDAAAYLKEISAIEDSKINLGKAALALAGLSEPGVPLGQFLHHFETLSNEVRKSYDLKVKAGQDDGASLKISCLKEIMNEKHGYTGDIEDYDNLQNASMIQTIRQTKGLPITLCILYIQVGRLLDWNIEGLNVPGHFLCALQESGQKIIFDPFNNCKIVEAPDLRFIVKNALGPEAEISAQYFQGASNKDILIRLQNNIKTRQISSEDYEGALRTVQNMQLFAPNEYRLYLDAGVLYARNNQAKAALKNLEEYMERAPNKSDQHEAALLIQSIKESLH